MWSWFYRKLTYNKTVDIYGNKTRDQSGHE